MHKFETKGLVSNFETQGGDSEVQRIKAVSVTIGKFVFRNLFMGRALKRH